MYLLIVCLPGLACLAAIGPFIGQRGAAVVTTTCALGSFLLSLVAFYEVGLGGSACYLSLGSLLFSEMLDATWGLLIDGLGVVMLVVVTFVSSLVHIYSVGYMAGDPHSSRFMCLLSMFTFFMLILVSGDNFVQVFVGWEGVGLASYLLINFWHTRLRASRAAMKALLVNRVGDLGFAIGILGCFTMLHSVDFCTIFSCGDLLASSSYFLVAQQGFPAITVICLTLFVGAVGKSAQIGLHPWLADAMEGPTPVSALIHAATMVTAGVFMIARCAPLYEYAPNALIVLTVFGAMTSFFAASTASLQHDLKRVIAFSTCSQLGYMIFALGISHYAVSVFHLMNHACFKAILFLSAGSVIHAWGDDQDLRKMGGLAPKLPLTYASMLIGGLSLIGFPYLTGFFSKDVILELAYTHYTMKGNLGYWLGSVSVFLTSYYSWRSLLLTFWASTGGATHGGRAVVHSCGDASIVMAIPLIILASGSIFIGYLSGDMMIGAGTTFWANPRALPYHDITAESEFSTPTMIKLIPILFGIAGGLVATWAAHGRTIIACGGPAGCGWLRLYWLLNRRWFFDQVFRDFVMRPVLRFGYHVSLKALDTGAIELLGPAGIRRTMSRLAAQYGTAHSGWVDHSVMVMLIGLTMFLSLAPWDSVRPPLDTRLYWLVLLGLSLHLCEPSRR
uniref:NADH-ubiquinone oxidoreductase chain 5 n=1 Tax=Selaginella moellendorffii TaxID=88036 RepID=F2YI94_SELML|nr:NADH dehydrogenase subunit 5 [Selaginella moellendorffii]AEA29875.1 NADH dehydrogenase subunit 5 [Selaginella moellendorffii]